MKKRYDLRRVMQTAWRIFKKYNVKFSEALRRAWAVIKAEPINAGRIAAAKEAAGIIEEVDTWAGWKNRGYEVRHGSKAVFQTKLIWASKGNGAIYKASFFASSQVVMLGV